MNSHEILEAQCLGGLIRFPALIAKTGIGAAQFADGFHAAAFGAVVAILSAGETPDPVAVHQRLGPVGDLPRILTAWKETAPVSESTVENWCESVKRAYRSRGLDVVLFDARAALAKGEPPHAVAARVLDGIAALESSGVAHVFTMEQALAGMLEEVQSRHDNAGKLKGVGCGLIDLDAVLSGFQAGRLYILGSRPAMGKTSLMLDWAVHAAIREGRRIGIISAEMGHQDLAERAVASHGRIDSQHLATGDLDDDDWPKLTRAVMELAQTNVRIYDKPAASVAEVAIQARAWALAGGLDIVFVDYLSLLTTEQRQDNRVREVGELARAMKTLARRLEIPVVALAQLSRQCEQRPNKRPVMSDLRDSGEVEQEADAVLFLYRDEVYHPDTDMKGIAEISLAKNRHGPLGTVRTAFLGPYFRFENLARGEL